MKKSINKFKQSSILLPVTFIAAQILIINKVTKFLKLKIKSKSRNNKQIKILSLEGISNPITLEKLIVIEKPRCFINVAQGSYNSNEKNFIIECKESFSEIECEKKFIFQNNKLKSCNFILVDQNKIMDMQKVYEEITNTNGIPDEIKFDKEIFLLQCIWYGSNGVIVYNHFYQCEVVITFDLIDYKL